MLRNSKSFWPCRGSCSFPLRQSIGLVGQQSGGLNPPAHSPRLLSTKGPTYFSPTLSPLPASRSLFSHRHPSGSFISVRKMSSATSFYDFKPLDSTCDPAISSQRTTMRFGTAASAPPERPAGPSVPMNIPANLRFLSSIRAQPGGQLRRLQGQGRPHH